MLEVKKEKRKINYSIILTAFFCLLLGIILGSLGKQNTIPDTIQDVCLECNKVYGDRNNYDVVNITKILNKMMENCNTDYAGYREYDKIWVVSQEDCLDGRCKYNFINVDNCYYSRSN